MKIEIEFQLIFPVSEFSIVHSIERIEITDYNQIGFFTAYFAPIVISLQHQIMQCQVTMYDARIVHELQCNNLCVNATEISSFIHLTLKLFTHHLNRPIVNNQRWQIRLQR